MRQSLKPNQFFAIESAFRFLIIRYQAQSIPRDVHHIMLYAYLHR